MKIKACLKVYSMIEMCSDSDGAGGNVTDGMHFFTSLFLNL